MCIRDRDAPLITNVDFDIDSASDAGLTVLEYGEDIIESDGMQSEKRYVQHGTTTTFEHSMAVAQRAVRLVNRFNLDHRVDMRDLVVSALLHDYFLYDWHDNAEWHRLHGFTHGRIACLNAMRDFGEAIVNDVVADSLTNHMYPLTNVPPKYPEGWLVSLSDKICATSEAVNLDRFRGGRELEDREALPIIPSMGATRPMSSADPMIDGIGPVRSGAYRTLLALRRGRDAIMR